MDTQDAQDSFQRELEEQLQELIEENTTEETHPSTYPNELFVIPLNRRPFFPGMAAPILIEPGPFYEMLKVVANQEEKFLALVMTKQENANIQKTTISQLHPIGVVAKILRIVPMEGEGAQVVLNIEDRLRLVSPIKSKYLKARVEYYPEPKEITDEVKAYAINIISIIKELLKLNPLFKEELQIFLGHSDFTDPGRLSDFAVALTTATRDELQKVLAAIPLQARAELALSLLKKELDLSLLQNNINKKIEATISKTQKEYFLKEQLKTIKKELGIEKDERSIDLEKFESRLSQRLVPDAVMDTIQEEMDKLSSLDSLSAEYSVCRNYLDWITLIPWGIFSKERFDLVKAEKVLQDDHYGLEEIKQRILELISVGKLTGGIKGSILCLVGPPGVGKTSVGRSIARALHREFYRFSVGGMRDEAEIKGHRRTYVGAMPGKLVQALKQTQTMNPVVMIDEIDKMGASYQGDPGAALLEVLDPEQNQDFLDHYLDIQVDLSHVLFIVTANVLDNIPEPLLDRMEILRLSGYILEEKVEIAKKYLIPRARKASGLKVTDISFSSDTLRRIVNGYSREAGVRSLENNIKKILRKVALSLVQEQDRGRRTTKKWTISSSSLEGYLGKPVHQTDRFYASTPIGVASGLAWTSQGGATLYIEAIRVASEKTSMILTGQAGDVMKESSQIAWNYVHSALHKYAPGFAFFEQSQVHMHIPEGATPKDGPSAGCTMVTALLSLLLGVPVLHNVAMTGEITLTGRILAVGGIREKLIAARRSELSVLIFPKDNQRDCEELPDYLKEGLSLYFVDHYDEIFPLVFPGHPLS